LAAILKSWRALEQTEVREITRANCKEWATAYGKKASATRYNNSVAMLRHVLDVAVDAGVLYSDPAATLERIRVRGKQVVLPSAEQFTAIIGEMRAGHSRDSKNCADFAEGMAYTGARKGEAGELELRDLDFDSGEVIVRGDPQTGTKNWEVRRVPMIPDARTLFERMLAERADERRETLSCS
jgi:integrase